jgi:hypothetical protein
VSIANALSELKEVNQDLVAIQRVEAITGEHQAVARIKAQARITRALEELAQLPLFLKPQTKGQPPCPENASTTVSPRGSSKAKEPGS